MVLFIERHWKVRKRSLRAPVRNHRPGVSVDNGHFFGVWQVYENPTALLLKLKRLGVRIQLHVRDMRTILPEDRQRTTAVSDVHFFAYRIESHVICIRTKIDRT